MSFNMLTMCVINGFPMQYHAAFPVDYAGKISKEFKALGKGMIHSCGGIPYKSRKKFNFYISRKNIKRFL